MNNKTIALAVIAVLLVSFGTAPSAEAIVALAPAAAVYVCLAVMGAVTIGTATNNNSDGSEVAVLDDQSNQQPVTDVAYDKPLDEGSRKLASIEENSTR
jgi:hypothetical protein